MKLLKDIRCLLKSTSDSRYKLPNVNFVSYSQLKQISASLDQLGVARLSSDQTEEDLAPFRAYYNEIRDGFSIHVLSDLAMVFPGSMSVLLDKFHPADPDARGTGHITYRILFNEDGMSYEMRVECLPFEGRIVLSFDDPSFLELPLSPRTKKVLHNFQKLGPYHYMNELRYLLL